MWGLPEQELDLSHTFVTGAKERGWPRMKCRVGQGVPNPQGRDLINILFGLQNIWRVPCSRRVGTQFESIRKAEVRSSFFPGEETTEVGGPGPTALCDSHRQLVLYLPEAPCRPERTGILRPWSPPSHKNTGPWSPVLSAPPPPLLRFYPDP